MVYEVVLTEFYTPANGGRSYSSERVVASYDDPIFAKEVTNQLNSANAEGKIYSVRKVEN